MADDFRHSIPVRRGRRRNEESAIAEKDSIHAVAKNGKGFAQVFFD
jgi:hypothetical protein